MNETLRAVAPTCYGVPCDCTGYGAVRAQPSAVVSVWGAAQGNALPAPRGDAQRVATPVTLADIQGARAEEIPDCSSHSLRIPWIATPQ